MYNRRGLVGASIHIWCWKSGKRDFVNVFVVPWSCRRGEFAGSMSFLLFFDVLLLFDARDMFLENFAGRTVCRVAVFVAVHAVRLSFFFVFTFAFTDIVSFGAFDATSSHVAIGGTMTPSLTAHALHVVLFLRPEFRPFYSEASDDVLLFCEFVECDGITLKTHRVSWIFRRMSDLSDFCCWNSLVVERFAQIFWVHEVVALKNENLIAIFSLAVGEVCEFSFVEFVDDFFLVVEREWDDSERASLIFANFGTFREC